MSSTRKFFSWCLFPLTMWYAVGVAVRNFLFNIGLKKETAFRITTIGLGNLATGGTGKTPHAEYILRLLQDDYRVAYLSRGYRRRSKGFVLCDGEPNPQQIGDEAAMIAGKFPHVMVAVCEKRVTGVKRLMAMENPPQVIVLDDCFQHRSIKPTCNILLTEYNRPYFHDSILPFGNLREFSCGKTRANIVIVTKTPNNLNPIMRHNVMNDLGTLPCQKVFFSSMEYGTPYTFDGNDKREITLGEIDHYLVVTGVAHPEALEQHLKQYGAVTARHFGDHHAFTTDELQQLRKDFEEIHAPNKAIITTEKDASRLNTPEYRALLEGLPIYVLPLKVKIDNSPDFDFDKIILSTVKENISFLHKLSTTKLSF